VHASNRVAAEPPQATPSRARAGGPTPVGLLLPLLCADEAARATSDPIRDPARLAAIQRYRRLGALTDLDDFASMAAAVFGAKGAAVTYLDDAQLWMAGSTEVNALMIAREEAFCAAVVETGSTYVVPDTHLDPRWAGQPRVVMAPRIRFYAGAPITVSGGHTLGSICIFDTVPRTFTDDDRHTLEAMARRVVGTLELELRTLELERERGILASTSTVLSMIVAGADLTDVLRAVAEAVELRDPDVLCSILLLEGQQLRDAAGPSLPPEYRAAVDGVTAAVGVGCCAEAAATGLRTVSEDLEQDPRWEPFLPAVRAAGLRACWSTPILSGAGVVLGTFAMYFREPRRPGPEHWALAEQWSDLAGLAITRSRDQAQLWATTLTDALTGLPNRAALLAECTAALADVGAEERATSPAALLFVDLDRFKVLNDSLGHGQGDDYLSAIAGRLSVAAGADAVVGRFGGDEFVVLAAPGSTEQDVRALGQCLLEAGRQPVTVGHRQVSLSLSIGIAFARESGLTALSLLRNADTAMHRAKDLGRDRAVVFDTALHEAALQRLEFEESLRDGLATGQFTLNYQPKVCLRDGDVVGVEALLRWTHPVLGSVSPVDFIPVAEDSGLIVPLGAWVLQEAVTAHAERRRTDPQWRGVVMWVNVAPAQLGPDLVDLVRDVLDRAGVPAEKLGIEVTEGSFMTDLPAARSVLVQLRELGVRLALDDFGTGYSSLGQLRHLPLHVIKVDKSFVDHLGWQSPNEGIVVAVLALARAHGLKVVAEGVETLAQVERLTALGCDVAQGFYFAEPGALDAVPHRYPLPERLERRLPGITRSARA
jgi:diguanylate cyclase (GGDEF)-like protein